MFGDDLLSFKLSLNNPSKIAELQEIEHWNQKFTIAAAATEGYFSRRWVADNIFGMSHDEFLRTQREMYYDRKHDAALQQVAEAAAAGETAGALGGGMDMGGGMGADLGGGMDMGADLGGGEEMPAGEAEAGAGDDSSLLAVPPGSRSSPRLTPGAKGKVYHPVHTDKRPAGARTRSTKSQFASEKGSATMRNILPGYADGLKSLGKGFVPTAEGMGIYEEDQSIYSLREETEEKKLFQINESVRTLIKDLEGTTEKLTEQDDEVQT